MQPIPSLTSFSRLHPETGVYQTVTNADALVITIETLLHNKLYLSALEAWIDLKSRGLDSLLTVAGGCEAHKRLEAFFKDFLHPNKSFSSSSQRISRLTYDLRIAAEDKKDLEDQVQELLAKSAPSPISSPTSLLRHQISQDHNSSPSPSPAPSNSDMKVLNTLVSFHLRSQNCLLSSLTFSDECPSNVKPYITPNSAGLSEPSSLMSLYCNNSHSSNNHDSNTIENNAAVIELEIENAALKLKVGELEEELKGMRENKTLEIKIQKLTLKLANVEEDLAYSLKAPRITSPSPLSMNKPIPSDFQMSSMLSANLPEICALLPPQDRISLINPLLLSSILYCRRESERKNLIIGLILILKKPNKAQRFEITNNLTTLARDSLEMKANEVENLIVSQALALKAHNVEDIRLLVLQICGAFADDCTLSYIVDNICPEIENFVINDSSSSVRKNAVICFAKFVSRLNVTSKKSGHTHSFSEQFLYLAFSHPDKEVQSSASTDLFPAVVDRSFTEGKLWNGMLKGFVDRLARVCEEGEPSAEADATRFFFAGSKGLVQNLPRICKLIFKEVGTEDNDIIADVVNGTVCTDSQIMSWPGLNFVTMYLIPSLISISSKPKYQHSSIRDSCYQMLLQLGIGLGSDYVNAVILPRLLHAMGVRLNAVLNERSHPFIIAAETCSHQSDFSSFNSIMGLFKNSKDDDEVKKRKLFTTPPLKSIDHSYTSSYSHCQEHSFTIAMKRFERSSPLGLNLDDTNDKRTCVVKSFASEGCASALSGMIAGDEVVAVNGKVIKCGDDVKRTIIEWIGENGGSKGAGDDTAVSITFKVLRRRVSQSVRTGLIRILVEGVIPALKLVDSSCLVRKIIIGCADNTIPVDVTSCKEIIQRIMCYSETEVITKEIKTTTLVTLFTLTLHKNTILPVKILVVKLLKLTSLFVPPAYTSENIVPCLVSICENKEESFELIESCLKVLVGMIPSIEDYKKTVKLISVALQEVVNRDRGEGGNYPLYLDIVSCILEVLPSLSRRTSQNVVIGLLACISDCACSFSGDDAGSKEGEGIKKKVGRRLLEGYSICSSKIDASASDGVSEEELSDDEEEEEEEESESEDEDENNEEIEERESEEKSDSSSTGEQNESHGDDAEPQVLPSYTQKLLLGLNRLSSSPNLLDSKHSFLLERTIAKVKVEEEKIRVKAENNGEKMNGGGGVRMRIGEVIGNMRKKRASANGWV